MQKRPTTVQSNLSTRPNRSERVSKVRNLRTGEVFLTSNLFEKDIGGETFVGVFKTQEQLARRDPNWMRKDLLVKHRDPA